MTSLLFIMAPYYKVLPTIHIHNIYTVTQLEIGPRYIILFPYNPLISHKVSPLFFVCYIPLSLILFTCWVYLRIQTSQWLEGSKPRPFTLLSSMRS